MGRYYVLLAFGASYSVGAQMASVSVVLPFLLAQKGILWAAGLLYPTFSIGFIAGNALSPLVVERSRRRQNAVIATAAATIAALTACIAVAGLRDAFVAAVFLLASLLIGCAMGMANNAYAEIISRMLDRPRRNQLLLNQEAVGAVLTVAATLLILAFGKPMLWLFGPGFAGAYPVLREDLALVLGGDRVTEVLAQVCNVNFNALDIGQRPIVMTLMVGVSVLVLPQQQPDGAIYRIWCDPSFGAYLWETLEEVVHKMPGRNQ